MIWERTGKQPKELAAHPDPLPEFEGLWNVYWEIASVEAMGYTSIAAYESVTGIKFGKHDSDILFLINRLVKESMK